MKIIIDEDVEDAEEIAHLLEEVVKQIRKGFTSGYSPYWYIIK